MNMDHENTPIAFRNIKPIPFIDISTPVKNPRYILFVVGNGDAIIYGCSYHGKSKYLILYYHIMVDGHLHLLL